MNSFFKKCRIALFSIPFFISSFTHSTVYDCFCFYNEFEILKMRLEELWDVVDYFVLVECTKTQKGKEKPLYFLENAALFQKYAKKIIHIAVRDDVPDSFPIDPNNPLSKFWAQENHQRNGITRALSKVDPNDIIMISDLDEIPRPNLLCIMPDILKYYDTVALQQSIYFFRLNRQTPTRETWGGGHWIGTVITTGKSLQNHTPQYFRDHRFNFLTLWDAGWHFTWMGSNDQIRMKAAAVVETPEEGGSTPDQALNENIYSHPIVPIDETFPKYIRENIDYFKSIGYID